jgi:hypothetical protein
MDSMKKIKLPTRYLREFWQRKPITKVKELGKQYNRKKDKNDRDKGSS